MLQENLIGTFERSIKENWELNAFTDYGKNNTRTFGQVAVEIKKLHYLFESCKIKKDDKIALMGANNSEWCIAYIATLTYGAVIVPILQDFKADDALHIINHSEAKLFFVTERLWEDFEIKQMPTMEHVFSLTTFEEIATNAPKKTLSVEQRTQLLNEQYPNGYTKEDVAFAPRPNDEIASINYTSGTTGFTKGVVTPLNALMANVKFCAKEPVIPRGGNQVIFLPLAHAFGCAFDFLTSFCKGAHCHFIGRIPSPKILLKAFAELKPYCVFTVPLILEKIYKKQIQPILGKSYIHWALKIPFVSDLILSKIKDSLEQAFGGDFYEIIIGGAPLNKEVDDFLHKIKFKYTVGYGMTECAPLITFAHYDQYVPGSCGRALGNGLSEIKIVDPNEEGIGEVYERGEVMTLGYYKNEEETKKLLTDDGWMRTGDLGTIDEKGNLFIKGRNKTMLLGASGQNIYPEEIESKLNNMPYVMESLVINAEGGLVALVYPDYEMVDANHLTEQQLNEMMENNHKELNKMLASYEQIKRIKLYPHEFEKTPKKSIKRYLYTHA